MTSHNGSQKHKYKKPEPIFIKDSSLSGFIPLLGIVIFMIVLIFFILTFEQWIYGY